MVVQVVIGLSVELKDLDKEDDQPEKDKIESWIRSKFEYLDVVKVTNIEITKDKPL